MIGRYFYDGEGKRIKKETATETTVFVYSAGKLIAEYSTATPPSNPTTSWTVTDQLGSPRVIVNSLGAVISRRDFMPFGEELDADQIYRKTDHKYGQTDSVRQKFTGYQNDKETGLDFAEARMYQNLHGRFTAVDPLLASGKSGNPQTFNRYVYVMNSPLILSDPNGLQAGFAAEAIWVLGNYTCAAGKFFCSPPMAIVNQTYSYDGQTTTVRSQIPAGEPYYWRDDPKLAGLADPERRGEQAYAMGQFVGEFPSGVSDRAKSYVDIPNFDLVPRTSPSLSVLPKISLNTFGVPSFFNYAPPPTNEYQIAGRSAGGLALDLGVGIVTGKIAGSLARLKRQLRLITLS